MKLKDINEVTKLQAQRARLVELQKNNGKLVICYEGNGYGDYYGHVRVSGNSRVLVEVVIDTEISLIDAQLRKLGVVV